MEHLFFVPVSFTIIVIVIVNVGVVTGGVAGDVGVEIAVVAGF